MDTRPAAGFPLDPFSLREGESARRPDVVGRLGFDHVYGRAYISAAAPLAGSIVPIEHVRPGDEQVVVRGRWGEREAPLSIDFLADVPSVQSVVVDRPVMASRPLPGIRELFVVNDRVTLDRETLTHLPGLVSLSLGSGLRDSAAPEGVAARAPVRAGLDLAVLQGMPTLRDLRFRADAAESIEPLGSLRTLERLRVEGVPSTRSARLLAPLHRLRWLAVEYWTALRSLRGLSHLERVELMGAALPDLRAFTDWLRLRSLALNGRAVKSLEGIGGLAALEELFLGGIGARDLAPLAGLPRLRRLQIVGAERVEDLAQLAHIGSLRSLALVLGTVARTEHVASLDFVAGLTRLEELDILGAVIDDGRLEPLLGLPALRRVRLAGSFGDGVERLRRRNPACAINVVPVEPADSRPASAVGPLAIRAEGDGTWAIVQDLSDLLGVDDNFAADRRIRGALRRFDPGLLARLELDPDADFVSLRARSEADIRRAAQLVRDLFDAPPPGP